MTPESSLEEFMIARHLPAFAQRVLIVGPAREGLATALRERGIPEIHVIEPGGDATQPVPPGFDSAARVPLPAEGLPFPKGHFDSIAFLRDATSLDALGAVLASLAPFLAPQGYVLVETPNNQYWRGDGSGSNPNDMETRVAASGLVLYGVLRALDPESQTILPDANGNMVLGGVTHHIEQEIDRLELIVTSFVFVVVRPDYDPMSHSGALFDDGHPEWAYTVLSMIPAPYLEDEDVYVHVFSDIQLCQLAMVKGAVDWEKRLDRFSISQEAFYRVVARRPHLHVAYQCQAQFWRMLGNDNMAARLLRSVLHAAPDERAAEQLAQFRPRHIHVREETPVWCESPNAARILFINHPRPHYGLDVLYDGLCTVLGASNVTDFPWKPSLHGQPPREMANYPCMFNRPGRPMPLEKLLERLAHGQYDAVLFGDLEYGLDRGMARRIIHAAGRIPVYIVDEQDDARDSRREVMEFLGMDAVAGFFKREMIEGADYGPNAHPLPFAYPDRLVPAETGGARTRPVFWAGHRMFGLRRLYLEYLESARGLSLSAVFDQSEYVRVLLESRIGLNIFGCGFDTVRYWELPAHGCMLLSERLPIRIPHNFRDGESAVFFDDLGDLDEKLAYYLAHPKDAEAIARAGHAHFKRYHTGSMRARQLLSWMKLA